MAEESGQEGFFWDTYPWVMADKSGGVSGDDDKSAGDDKKPIINSTVTHDHSKMKQSEMEALGGLNGGHDQEPVTTTVGGDGGQLRNEMKNDDNKKVSLDSDKGKGDPESNDHDFHIWTERERRKKMRNMFHQLHALLPQLPPKVSKPILIQPLLIKADKSTIVDEAVSHIKTLQETLQKLHTQKLERLHGLSSNTTISPLIQPQTLALNTRESFLADHGSTTGPFGIVPSSSSTSFPFPIFSPTAFQTWTSSNVTLNVCGLDAHISICSPRKPGLLTAICFVMEKHKLEIVSAQISSDQTTSLFMIHARASSRDQFLETFPYEEVFKQAATEIMLWVNSK
ncbi:Myc-type, basic helix-loop-helix (bHLH) domain-containing protein [Cynara cardunculus var. scolymus]|uniref:Myc-type, basic helix-loop-helix (BHLH) domain-containing protein n=1 Tax=Cynara cardunculus var. scolymus TaxID=59895 RepID=A0A103Y3N2_CYNCS|nr:Myc-type, basic helix-loop-helix (bHLH) domain-containing protein [Cynara cardunculus var. scolymus]